MVAAKMCPHGGRIFIDFVPCLIPKNISHTVRNSKIYFEYMKKRKCLLHLYVCHVLAMTQMYMEKNKVKEAG